MIQAVILAGGLGTRLGPLTRQVPKPLVAVSGKPFLYHQIELLHCAGIRNVLLLVSHLASKIVGYLGDGSRLGVNIKYVREEVPLGTAGALKNAAANLADDFMLFNGDTLTQVDYLRVVEAYRQRRAWGLIVAFDNSDPAIPNNLAVAPDGTVTRYGGSDRAGLTHVEAGVAVFNRRILELIAPDRVCSLGDELYPRLIECKRLQAYSTRQRFYDIGTPAGLRALEDVLRRPSANR